MKIQATSLKQGTSVLVYGVLVGRVVQILTNGESGDGRAMVKVQLAKFNLVQEFALGYVELYSDAVLSANRIKNAIRQHLSYSVFRARLNFSTWNLLEALQEQRTMMMVRFVKISASINELNSMVPLFSSLNSVQFPYSALPERERIKASLAHYRGVRVLFPLRLNTVKRLINQFRNGILLHPVFVLRILEEAERLFLNMHGSPMNSIQLPPGVKLVVVGDLHGQLEDLLTIMENCGVPSSKTWYLFNGDFVDRGARGVEIVLLLLAFKLLYPDFVFLNRGNHEERMINEIFGFQEEVYAKYGIESDGWSGLGTSVNYSAAKLFQLFEAVFDLFPIFALVNRRVFVVHGGLSNHENVTIEELVHLDHRGEPTQGTSRADELLMHLLWSDPCSEDGWKPSSRGAGVEFGPDITKAFCQRNGINLIIRSHECREEGYDIVHDGLLLTVFSASSYCGSQTNKGAYVLLERDEDTEIQPRVIQFSSQPLQKLKAAGTNEWRDKACRLQRRTLESLLHIICENQQGLMLSFRQCDSARCGRITKLEWKATLQRVLGVQANFLSYFRQLAKETEHGGVDYCAFISESQSALRAIESDGSLHSMQQQPQRTAQWRRDVPLQSLRRVLAAQRGAARDLGRRVGACSHRVSVAVAGVRYYDRVQLFDQHLLVRVRVLGQPHPVEDFDKAGGDGRPQSNVSSDSLGAEGDDEDASLSRLPTPRASVETTTRNRSLAGRNGRALQEERENQEIAVVDCELRDQEDRLNRCAVTELAARYFEGHEWVAAVWVAVFICAITSATLLFWIQRIPELQTTEFYEYRWTFAIATGFVVGLSACFTPDWQYGVIMLIKYVVFIFLTLHSTACPMNQGDCNVAVATSHVFLIGFLVVLVFRFASSRSNAEAFVTFMLDVVGLVYITGSLSILVSFVDDDIRILYRKLLIALLYIVWASDTGAYLVGKSLAFFNYPYYNPLAPHLSKNKDYEGTLGAIVFGIMAMVVASDILDLPGSFGTKVVYTVIAVVAGRLGDLFESLLKRAAGVKDSGKLIPGHGGALDRIDALICGGQDVALPAPMVRSPQESFPYLRGASSTQLQSDSTIESRWESTWRLLHYNAVQRVASAIVLVPVVTAFLWLSPAFGTTTACSFATSRFDRLNTGDVSYRNLHGSEEIERETSAQVQRTPEDNSTSTARSSPVLTETRGYDTPSTWLESDEHELSEAADEAIHGEDRPHTRAVTRFALHYFNGHEGQAAVFVAAVICAISTSVFLLTVQWLHELKSTEFYQFRWSFTACTGFVAGLCACMAPDWKFAVVTLVHYFVFVLLTMHSAACATAETICILAVSKRQIFLGGVLVLIVFRFSFSRNGVEAFVTFMLDVLGLVYIICPLSVIVAFVDDSHRLMYRKLLIALLYVVWASDTGAYIVGKTLEYFNYSHYHRLAPHISKNKDYEGTVGAIIFGVVAMFVASEILDLPGSFSMKVGYTVTAVLFGRLGDLFESLLKRAAGVKDSGTLIPGHGGLLDRIDALMFATVVFSRYYKLRF
ncbi:hypothetical protein ON010_g10504 [Phytophthora cinnamomi]|nr:hypothetical protein ON010_g10504 [Phytophthora cinnamomi]